MSHSEPSSDVEIIEDSEPERVQRRFERQKLLEAKKIPSKSSQSQGSRSATTTQVSTLLPASGSSNSAVSTAAPHDGLEESQVSVVPPPAPSSAPAPPARKIAPPPWLVPTEPPAQTQPAAPSPLDVPTRTKPSSQPSPVKQLDLNRFAFQKRPDGRSTSRPAPSRSVSSLKDVSTESCSDVPKAASGSAAKVSAPKTFYLGAAKGSIDADATFTADQISSLGSCVVCGNAWTVRKQAKSKWSHITACARKQGCGLDILHVKLIAAVVDASEAKANKSTKGKEKEKEPDEPWTLLAHTVQEHAPPKRRGRRKDPAPSSLQPAEDNRKAILDRGTVLLGVAPVLDNESQPQEVVETPATQPEFEEADVDVPNIPSTQAFAPSRIAGRSRFFGSALAPTNVDSRSGLFYADPPCTISSTTSTRSLSTFQLPSSSDNIDPHVFLPTPRSASPAPSSDVSIISITSSNESDSDQGDFRVQGDHAPISSPTRSDSSASIIIFDSPQGPTNTRPASFRIASPVHHPTSSPLSSTRQLYDEEPWDSQAGVFMWDDYAPSDIARPPSPTESLAEYLYEMSLRENDPAFGEQIRGRSRSPRMLAKSASRSRSRKGSNSSRRRSKSPSQHPSANKGRSKSPNKPSRSGSGGLHSRAPQPKSAGPASGKARTKARTVPKSRSKSRQRSASRSESRSRSRSPTSKKKRAKRKGTVYAPEEIEDGASSKDLDAKLLEMIMRDQTLYLRILRYEPIKFEDILNMAVENGIPKYGLQIKLKAFLDSQCINFYSEEALGRRKKRHG